jgi:hypothetical protein
MHSGANCLACDPRLVFFRIHATALDEAQADVDEVDIIHLDIRATGVGGAGEEPKDENVEAIGRVPIGSHSLSVGLAILGSCLAVLVDEPEEEIDKNDVRFAKGVAVGWVHAPVPRLPRRRCRQGRCSS